jgi:hypothetical protein
MVVSFMGEDLYLSSRESFPAVAFLAFVKKNNPHIRVLAGFLEFYVLKYVTKFTSILKPLATFWRGVNLPYFAK